MSLANVIIEGAEQPGPETAQGANPAPVEEAATVMVAVSTPEKSTPAARGAPVSSEPTKGAKTCGTPQVPCYPAVLQTTVFTVAQHQHLCEGKPKACNDYR